MEGVLVSAHRDGSNITVTVVTDTAGRYAFPATRLAPGHYTLSIRAVGYDLAGPKATDIAADAPATADLTLRKTTDLAAKLTNAEWMESLPGGADRKQFLQIAPIATACISRCSPIIRRTSSSMCNNAWRITRRRPRCCSRNRLSPIGSPIRASSCWKGGKMRYENRPNISPPSTSASRRPEFSIEDVSASDRQRDACGHHGIRSSGADAHAA